MNDEDTGKMMEASHMLAEAVEIATKLGFTLCTSGGTVDVFHWDGVPLRCDNRGNALFEAQCLTNLLDWLDGVKFGRSNVGVR